MWLQSAQFTLVLLFHLTLTSFKCKFISTFLFKGHVCMELWCSNYKFKSMMTHFAMTSMTCLLFNASMLIFLNYFYSNCIISMKDELLLVHFHLGFFHSTHVLMHFMCSWNVNFFGLMFFIFCPFECVWCEWVAMFCFCD